MSSNAVLVIVLTVLFSCVSRSSSYRYLTIPIPMKSHAADMAAIAAQLVRQGHDVTFLLPDKFPVPNDLREAGKDESMGDRIQIERYERPALGKPLDFDEAFETLTRMILENRSSQEEVWKFVNSLTGVEGIRLFMHNEDLFKRLTQRHFDMAVVDSFPMIQFLCLVPHRLRLPLITVSDSVNPLLVRVPWLPSFVPFVLASSTERMDFFERVQNFLLTLIFSGSYMLPQPDASVMTKYQEYGEFGSLNDIVASSVLWITTRDVVLDYSKPTMPNMIDAGGLTVKPVTGQLPAEIARFADGAEKGLIIFSFGSAAYKFPSALTKKFVTTFERLPGYRIIWRFGSDKGTVLPDNVMALEWLPQNELLAHPKTKLFITHCGNNGQFEALYHAVPMIGFPLNGDQPYNARRMEYRGYGIAMDIHEFTSDELLNNVHRVLSNQSYSENIGLASSIWRSSLQRPAERAVWWIEHVTKYGSKHLKSFGSQLNLVQYFSFDVMAFLLTVVGLVAVCLWKTIRFLARTIQNRGKDSSKQKTQ